MASRDLQLTPDAPWPGPAAYTERDTSFFYGRATETAELHRLVRAEPVSVLYALSGLGKTSLLSAGLAPRLRAEGWLPVRIRLDHRDLDDSNQPVSSLPSQVLSAVANAAQEYGVTAPEWDEDKDTLATAFHERGDRFWGSHEEEPVTPVLIFDQFEECWTLTRDRPEARARAEALLGQVAALIDWRGKSGTTPAPVRVVFALREDQLASLDNLRPLFRGLRNARLRLLPFTAAQAREVVAQPGQALLDHGATDAVVETFVARDAERPVADPALLSIFCWQLNERRRTDHAASITATQVVDMRGAFVREFYESAFTSLPPNQSSGARLFVEEDLIDAAGFRTSAGFEHAQSKYNISPATLERLVDVRLLHPVDRSGGHRHVELVHDRIAEEAAAQRATRREAETKQREVAEKQKLQSELTKAHRRALVLGTLAMLAFAALVFALIMMQKAKLAQQTAEEAGRLALIARTAAETANERTQAALTEANLQKTEADKHRAAAEASAVVITTEKAIAEEARNKAIAAKKSADDLIGYLQYDLHATLTRVGRLDLMKSVNDRIARYRESNPPEGEVKSDQRERISLFQQQGDIQRAQGDQKAALDSYRQALAISEQLAEQDSSNTQRQQDLSVSYTRVGTVLIATGDATGALELFKKSMAISEQLTKQEPGNSQWQREVSVSSIWVGSALNSLGEHNEALWLFQRSVELSERLTKQDPKNTQWSRDLSYSYQKVGEVLSAKNKDRPALEMFERSLAIRSQLAKKDPGNMQWQQDLAYSFDQVGDSQYSLGIETFGLPKFLESLRIRDRLAHQDPGNGQWQHDLSASYLKVAEAMAASGVLKNAMQFYRKNLSIREQLIKKNPGNTQWQRDLLLSQYAISQALERTASVPEALKNAEAAVASAERLVSTDPTNTTWKNDLAKCRDWLTRLRSIAPKESKPKK